MGVVEDQVRDARAHIAAVAAKIATTGPLMLEAISQPEQWRLKGMSDIVMPVLNSYVPIAASIGVEEMSPLAVIYFRATPRNLSIR